MERPKSRKNTGDKKNHGNNDSQLETIKALTEANMTEDEMLDLAEICFQRIADTLKEKEANLR
jgi:hypothetical protein